MEDIEKMWDDISLEYNDMHSRLAFVSRKDKNLLERRPIKDKLVLIMSDLKEITNTMGKVCFSIDEIYANQGTIGIKLNEDEHIQAKRINNNGKVFKVISASNVINCRESC